MRYLFVKNIILLYRLCIITGAFFSIAKSTKDNILWQRLCARELYPASFLLSIINKFLFNRFSKKIFNIDP